MLFNEFGKKENPPVLLMHGMLQQWQSEYELCRHLEERYRLIVPAMDGMYDGSTDFTSFSDQAKQIEEYVKENCDGRLHGIIGHSQGGLMVVELLTRNNIEIKTAVTDGVYVAHQGKLAAYFGIAVTKKIKKNGGKIPKIMEAPMKLMGIKKEDMAMFNMLYLKASDNTIKRNYWENYTYRTRPELKNTNTKVYLFCGSKEPYALKSHKILKKYLKNYEEEIFEGYGHCEFVFKHQDKMAEKLCRALG